MWRQEQVHYKVIVQIVQSKYGSVYKVKFNKQQSKQKYNNLHCVHSHLLYTYQISKNCNSYLDSNRHCELPFIFMYQNLTFRFSERVAGWIRIQQESVSTQLCRQTWLNLGKTNRQCEEQLKRRKQKIVGKGEQMQKFTRTKQ